MVIEFSKINLNRNFQHRLPGGKKCLVKPLNSSKIVVVVTHFEQLSSPEIQNLSDTTAQNR